MLRPATSIALGLALAVAGCASPAMKRTGAAPASSTLAELWIDPGTAPRNLYDGPLPVPRRDRPVVDGRYTVVSKDTAGFSTTYKVKDAAGRDWNVKIGPEAQTEVVTSRIVWALGYHALPSYFVERWIAVEHSKGAQLGGARFRPHDMSVKSRGTWAWHENPFVGARQYNGLLVLMVLLNSTDLKDDNNGVYEPDGATREIARRWFIVKDVGASLGETGRMDPRRGYIDGFEKEAFITGVRDGHVQFAFRGRHRELLQGIRVDDVRWTCERVNTLTDQQWHDAFRAGNFADEVTARYVARIRQKVKEGLELR
jgi:hypothetical protein